MYIYIYIYIFVFYLQAHSKMPGEVIDRPNPKPLPSQIPSVVDQLGVQLEKTKLDEDANRSLHKFRRAANYIAAGEFTVSK